MSDITKFDYSYHWENAGNLSKSEVFDIIDRMFNLEVEVIRLGLMLGKENEH